MKISVLTLFPEMFAPLESSILGKARQKGLLEICIVNIREFTKNKHKKCDDYPFGGGSGMVMSAQPIYDAVNSVDGERKTHRIYLSPKGKTLSQSKVKELCGLNKDLVLLCGHYEGVDQRVLDICFDEEISIGDYILTGGELPAMVLIDCLSRFVPGVLHSGESVIDESFSENSLEYPQYTRPENFMGYAVPEVLLSGNHANVKKWREEKKISETKKKRPDLLK